MPKSPHLPSRRRMEELGSFVKKIVLTGPEARSLDLAAALSRKSFSSWAAETLLAEAERLLTRPPKK